MGSPVADRLRSIRAMAVGEGDWNLVREVEREMARLGIAVVESAVAERSLETVTPVRPRGRPRKQA